MLWSMLLLDLSSLFSLSEVVPFVWLKKCNIVEKAVPFCTLTLVISPLELLEIRPY